MGNTRKSPHIKRRLLDTQYIEKILNPSTPEEMVLALQEPLSPAYKEFVNLVRQQFDVEIIIERLIEKYVLREYHLRQKEKEAFLRQMHIKDETDKEFASFIAIERDKHARLQAGIDMAARIGLEEIERELRNRLSKSDYQIKKINAALHVLQTKKDELTQQYRQQLMTSFENKKEEMSFVTMRLNEKGERVATPLLDPMYALQQIVDESPSPVDQVNAIEKSYEEAHKAHAIAMAQAASAIQFMPPTPPPLLKPKAAHYSAHDCLTREFNFITKKLAESSNPADILHAMKQNKCLKKVFHVAEDDKQQQCAIFKEAMEIGAKMRKGMHQLERVHEKHQQDMQLLDTVQERKQALMAEEGAGKTIDRNSHL